MANITISNLQPAGLNLFSDSEDYLNDLTTTEQDVQGGFWWVGAIMATAGAAGLGLAAAAIYNSGTNCGFD